MKRWGIRWRVRGIADPAGLPLLVLILSTLLFIATPLLNTVVRVTEREADAFGINTSREPDGMAKAALKLGACASQPSHFKTDSLRRRNSCRASLFLSPARAHDAVRLSCRRSLPHARPSLDTLRRATRLPSTFLQCYNIAALSIATSHALHGTHSRCCR